MSGFGQVPLKNIWAMLDDCAPGYTHKKHTHNYCIYYENKTYPSLPVGEHGNKNPLIEKGHIKRMARFFGILDCATAFLSL
jgi:hypothetical protein